jgi:hypothetical protein
MKEIEVKTIWQAPAYLPYIHLDLTEEIIYNAEKKIGYKLPIEFLNLLKVQNGGYIRYTIEGTLHHQIYGIGNNFPSITDVDWTDYDGVVNFELDGLIPFDGDGHWHICFDYRKNKIEPEITFIDTECDTEKSIAKSFKEYLGLLKIEAENEFVIETNLTLEETIKEISKILKIEFDEPEFYNYGYSIYRGKFNESWIWISPNKVPNGFVREDHERFNELKSKIFKTALRYPEISEDFLFISVSDDNERENLFKELADNSITTRPLKDLL